GLLGHLHELLAASGLAAELEAGAVPAIDGVLELLSDPEGASIAGGTRRNRAYAEEFATFEDAVPEARRWLACDALTSAGLPAAQLEQVGNRPRDDQRQRGTVGTEHDRHAVHGGRGGRPADGTDRVQRDHRELPVAALDQPSEHRDRAERDERVADVAVHEPG